MSKSKQTAAAKHLVIVRGGGDLATGTIQALQRSGFAVLVLETAQPSAIRRQIAVSEAVYEKKVHIEDIEAVLCPDTASIQAALAAGRIAVLVDPDGDCIKHFQPWALVDAILAKRNLGTTRQLAAKTIALGPGFTAGYDVDIVIETKRGHNLAQMITKGTAAANTGIPGLIAGYGKERVMHSPCAGYLQPCCRIGDIVEQGQLLARITAAPAAASQEVGQVTATLTGLLRGMIKDGFHVQQGLKIADIDPRKEESKNCFTISDKARSIGNAVVTSLFFLEQQQKQPGTITEKGRCV